MSCGLNTQLTALGGVRDSIKALLASKKAGLPSIAGLASSIKGKLSALKASVPSLTSFQTELAGMVGAGQDKIAAFEAKWAGKVPNLNNYLGIVTGKIAGALDFCKDVPNIKMDSAGKVITDAKVSLTPNSNPA
jgi:hypothetical protein